MKYRKTNVTSKNGINYIRSVVEATSCLFHKIEQENDLGIDCIIEFTKDEKPMHKSIAAQIKSGNSYYDLENNQCKIPVDGHYEYWSKYPLPVFGFVFIPQLDKAYSVNIKKFLGNNKETKVIKFECNRANAIDLKSFAEIFIPDILGDIPTISLEKAISFFESLKPQESYLGAKVLFRRYKNQQVTWDKFLDYLENNSTEDFNQNVIYFVAHIPWHQDIYHFGEIQNPEIRNYAKEKIHRLKKETVLKLISFINLEEGIVRGSIGQSIEAILSSVDDIENYLADFIKDENLNLEIKEISSAILAYYQGESSIKSIQKLASESLFAKGIIEFLREYKSFNLYE